MPTIQQLVRFQRVANEKKTKSPARIARDKDRTRPLISSGPPITSFFCAIVNPPFKYRAPIAVCKFQIFRQDMSFFPEQEYLKSL